MALKPCLNCGTLTNYGSRCQRCTGNRYGRTHRAQRQQVAPVVHLGIVDCARCGQPIGPLEPWALDHDDHGREPSRPSHRRCNNNPTLRTHP